MFGIGQSRVGEVVLGEIVGKCSGIFRTEDQNGRIEGHKFIIILTQLRHVRLAKRSHKTAIEDQQNVLLPFKLRKRYVVAPVICQRKIWCGRIEFNLRHAKFLHLCEVIGKVLTPKAYQSDPKDQMCPRYKFSSETAVAKIEETAVLKYTSTTKFATD